MWATMTRSLSWCSLSDARLARRVAFTLVSALVSSCCDAKLGELTSSGLLWCPPLFQPRRVHLLSPRAPTTSIELPFVPPFVFSLSHYILPTLNRVVHKRIVGMH